MKVTFGECFVIYVSVHREKFILYYEMVDGLYGCAPYFFSKVSPVIVLSLWGPDLMFLVLEFACYSSDMHVHVHHRLTVHLCCTHKLTWFCVCFQIISEIPEHFVFVVLYAIPVYYLSGLQTGSLQVLQNFATVFVVVYCSRSLAYLSSTLLPTYQISVLFAQMMFTLFLLSCGFIFNLDNLFIGKEFWNIYKIHV